MRLHLRVAPIGRLVGSLDLTVVEANHVITCRVSHPNQMIGELAGRNSRRLAVKPLILLEPE